MSSWIRQSLERGSSLVSAAILLREATRSSRRWQTYAIRTAFAGMLLAALLLGIHAVLQMANDGLLDIAEMGRVGRLLFIGYAFVTMSLVATIAPLTTANAVREEAEQRTLDLLVLTGLTPTQIVLGKVLSRIGILLAMVLGSMPVMLLAVNMGGVSGLEVVALALHIFTVALMGAALGGFFGLFTRSPMVSTAAALGYGIPFYAILPAGFALSLADPGSAAMFSPLSVAAASGASALAVPLSYAPSFVVVMVMLTATFDLRASGAHFQEVYSHELWHTKPWVIALSVWSALALISPVALPLAYLDGAASAGWASWLVGKAAGLWLWALMTFAYALCTWLYLRVSFDIVDALDGIFGRRGGVVTADAVRVGNHPVWWRETRHGTITIGPVLATWGLLMLGLLQTGWWLVPGGVLAMGIVNAIATLLLTAWLGARAFTDERRNHTLEALVTTTMGDGRIVFDKLSAVLWPTLPLWLVTGPMLAVGVPHLKLIRLYNDPSSWEWSFLFAGGFAWLWSLPVWVAVAGAAMAFGLRAKRPRSAFGLVVALTTVLLVPPALVGQLYPDLPVLAPLARLWAPGLTGKATILHYLVSTATWSLLALAIPIVLSRKLRSWALRVLAVLLTLGVALPADAQEDEELPSDLEALNQLEMDVQPWLDGYVRPDGWTAAVVELRNTGAPTQGELSLDEQLPGDLSSRWVRTIELPAGGSKRVVLPFVSGANGRKRQLRYTADGGRYALGTLELRRVPPSDILVVVLGDDNLGLPGAIRTATGESLPRHGVDTMPEMPAVPPDSPPVGGPRQVRSTTLPLAQVPTTSQVLSGVDWIVWPAADPSRLSQDQAQALAAWVVDGGHLVLTVSDTSRQLEASPLADILPGRIEGPRVESVDPFLADLRTRAERAQLDVRIPLTGPETPVAHFLPRTGTQTYARTASGQPLWVAAPKGTGSVHLLLTDLSLDPLASLDRQHLWRTLLWLPDDGPVALGFPAPIEDHDAVSPRGDFEHTIRRRLADVPGLAPLPIGWLGLSSLIYLLLIGPVDYFVLRWTRRQLWTWITFPTLVVGFSVFAFLALRSSKGSQAMLTRVELVDVFPDARHWQGTTHIGVFSTRKADLVVSSGDPDGVMSPLEEAGYLPVPNLTAGYGPGSVHYRAETWTMAYLRSEWVRPEEGRLLLQRLPDGRLQVENRLGFDLDELVLYELRVPKADFGAVADGAIATTEDQGYAPSAPLYDLPWHWRHDLRRGSLSADERHLVGHAAIPIDPVTLEGLSPVHRSDLIVRQKVRDIPAEETP